jgi:hypothetical protein
MTSLPEVGERIIVHGLTQHVAKVSSLVWDHAVHDFVMELDWGELGASRVKLHDENKVWYRASKNS